MGFPVMLWHVFHLTVLVEQGQVLWVAVLVTKDGPYAMLVGLHNEDLGCREKRFNCCKQYFAYPQILAKHVSIFKLTAAALM